MSRFALVEEADVNDPIVAQVYDEIRRELGFGMVPNLFKSMALRPHILRANWHKFRATVLEGHIPRTLKEMVGVLISQTNGSEYGLRVHLHGLSALGMSEELLQALVQDYEQCPLPEREKQVLRFGLLAATDPLAIEDQDYDRLRGLDMSDEEIFEIVATADLFASVNAYTDAAGVPIDNL